MWNMNGCPKLIQNPSFGSYLIINKTFRIRSIIHDENCKSHRVIHASNSFDPNHKETIKNRNNSLNDNIKMNSCIKRNVKTEKLTYQFAAFASTMLMFGLVNFATYYRFFCLTDPNEPFPVFECMSTIFLVFGGIIGMEFYARFMHKYCWHDFKPGYLIHKSHHVPRKGPFEANDIYAVMNAIPAFILCAYGFITPGEFGGICFGLGLGISMFGCAYMFVHDGLVHKRFPVGPISKIPYLQRVAAAHKLHHSDKYDGKPYGMFLGPQELENIPEAIEDINNIVASLKRQCD